MTDLKTRLLAPLFIAGLMLTGCGKEDSHSHDEEGAEGHGHSHSEEVTQGHSHSHDIEHALGEIEIAGTVLNVTLGGEPEPNTTLHIDLEHKSGPMPAAIRLWVGTESATGSIKTKANGTGGDYHADAQCPAELTDAMALWIEVESADGQRTTGSLPLEHHEE